MIRCYHCGTENLDGSEYCDECGTRLNGSSMRTPTYAPPPQPPPPPAFTRDPVTPKTAVPYSPPPPPPVPRSGSVSSISSGSGQSGHSSGSPGHQSSGSSAGGSSGPDSGRQPAASSYGRPGYTGAEPPAYGDGAAQHQTSGAQAGGRAKLVIQRGGKVGKEFVLSADESLIGRWDADGGIFPDVDLDQDDPEAKVSRRHARIQFQNNQFLIEDLGSTNGTFINRGPRLLPGTKQPLKNGDEIIVGKTFLKFVLN